VRAARLTVQRWVARYLRTHEPGALADRPRAGRPHVATVLTPGRLAAVLARDPRTLGYRATAWTAPLLAHHLRERERVAVSERTVRRRLRERRDRWKRPRDVYHQRAPHVAQKKSSYPPVKSRRLAGGGSGTREARRVVRGAGADQVVDDLEQGA
jgi:transposase